MTKAVLAVLVLVFAALAAWFYWSPGHTVHQLEVAARVNDTATVARLVDFKHVREQLLADITEARAPYAGKQVNMRILSKSVSPTVWSLVMPGNEMAVNQFSSPTGFAALVRTGGNTFLPTAPPDTTRVSMKHLKYPRSFQVVMVNPTPPPNLPYSDTVTMLLEREGIKWQVKQAHIPLNLCKAGCQVEVESPR